MDDAVAAFWGAVIAQMPTIVGAVMALLLAAFAWATRKLGEAGKQAAAEVEREKGTGPRLTPTEQMQRATQKVRNTLGVTGSLLPASIIRARVQDVVDSAHVMAAAKSESGRPLGPGASGEHAINLPPLDDLPRPTATASGFDIDVTDIADANETGDE